MWSIQSRRRRLVWQWDWSRNREHLDTAPLDYERSRRTVNYDLENSLLNLYLTQTNDLEISALHKSLTFLLNYLLWLTAIQYFNTQYLVKLVLDSDEGPVVVVIDVAVRLDLVVEFDLVLQLESVVKFDLGLLVQFYWVIQLYFVVQLDLVAQLVSDEGPDVVVQFNSVILLDLVVNFDFDVKFVSDEGPVIVTDVGVRLDLVLEST